ncbi:DUF2249 domain-containing protein [Saccharolobus solfataricus]|uniref:DUF2249 domain-containing protein n=3 Tax=Saccharolobus solfataricus TaxID=2287 RepID=Q97XD3_SACS2|nr:DUF2249 domain-containing protein [Saccharolobus solfataricus]AAK42008.1 Hypothetical protein SSO1812 [Saccharolobus solfataricus P2]AKA74724.1 DUF2249 domain-containing protein [Saccharolobus solfataricus]AKA77419.1 DUF2249 domain-containing protein [Saccharolobus solfataricus]AKA80110.1 DUF2249 domain-containing protein [Saccharolobus solfataricus]AZF69190.1 DUF2249 domain-containing protein [Saccharolobus solfataricus]
MELDLRPIQPEYRHKLVLESFSKLKEGEELTVIADHYPSHLIQLLSGYIEKYKVEETANGDFVLKLTKKKGSTNKAIISHISEFRKTGDVFTPIPVLRKDEYGVILVFFKPGQYIPIHAPDSDLIFYVLQGQGKVSVDNREYEVHEGSIVIVPRGIKRGVKADTYMEAIHIVVPSPSPEDHEKVMKAAMNGIAEVDLRH